jgi:hypothetical protein
VFSNASTLGSAMSERKESKQWLQDVQDHQNNIVFPQRDSALAEHCNDNTHYIDVGGSRNSRPLCFRIRRYLAGHLSSSRCVGSIGGRTDHTVGFRSNSRVNSLGHAAQSKKSWKFAPQVENGQVLKPRCLLIVSGHNLIEAKT